MRADQQMEPGHGREAERVPPAPRRGHLVDVYRRSMPSGWVRWIFTQFAFPFEVVYSPALNAGDLAAKFDVLVFEDAVVPDAGRGEGRGSKLDPASVPAEYRGRIGAITDAQTIMACPRSSTSSIRTTRSSGCSPARACGPSALLLQTGS